MPYIDFDFVAHGKENAKKRWENSTPEMRQLYAAKATFGKMKKDPDKARAWLVAKFGESRAQQYLDSWKA